MGLGAAAGPLLAPLPAAHRPPLRASPPPQVAGGGRWAAGSKPPPQVAGAGQRASSSPRMVGFSVLFLSLRVGRAGSSSGAGGGHCRRQRVPRRAGSSSPRRACAQFTFVNIRAVKMSVRLQMYIGPQVSYPREVLRGSSPLPSCLTRPPPPRLPAAHCPPPKGGYPRPYGPSAGAGQQAGQAPRGRPLGRGGGDTNARPNPHPTLAKACPKSHPPATRRPPRPAGSLRQPAATFFCIFKKSRIFAAARGHTAPLRPY